MVEVTRSNVVESVHYGTAILINSDGEILKEWGNANMMIYPRSALKPIQSLNLYKDGVAETINVSDELIALTTASHHAETIHQDIAKGFLFAIDAKTKQRIGADHQLKNGDVIKIVSSLSRG